MRALLMRRRRAEPPGYGEPGGVEEAPLAGRCRAAAIMPVLSVLYEAGHDTVYYRLDAQNRLLMGGARSAA